MKLAKLLTLAVAFTAITFVSSCTEEKFHIQGTITEAKDSMLYLDNMSLSGPQAIDSVKLDENGHFEFSAKASEFPEFYRLRIAGQLINLSIDSTETVEVSAAYPTMTVKYDVKGSVNCSKIKELAMMQLNLQATLDALAADPTTGVEVAKANMRQVLETYKNTVKANYIFKDPKAAYAYFALFQTVRIGQANLLVFNPHANATDVKVFAAVATSWDTFYPNAERGKNLHNIAIEGMKDVRIMQAQQQQIDPSKVQVTGLIDVALADNRGVVRHLNQMSGKVVLLDFHVFGMKGSTERIMQLRTLYNKYHDAGFDIYQVSLDPDEHFWKTSTAALPWISVRDPEGPQGTVCTQYNVGAVPTFFLIDKTNTLYKRDAQISNLEEEIKSLL